MNGWLIGYLVGAIVVLVVAAALLVMFAGARRVAHQTEDILAALRQARAGTAALWKVADTNLAADRIVRAAAAVREGLAGETSTGSEGGRR